MKKLLNLLVRIIRIAVVLLIWIPFSSAFLGFLTGLVSCFTGMCLYLIKEKSRENTDYIDVDSSDSSASDSTTS